MSRASTRPAALRADATVAAATGWLSTAEAIAERLRDTAVARDRASAPPHLEISWLRDSGLLTLLNPASAGGGDANFSDAFRVVRILARADTSIAQVLSYHYLLSHSAFWRATDEQRARLVRQSVEQKWFWGGASNPRDALTTLTADGDGYRLNGPRPLPRTHHWRTVSPCGPLLGVRSSSSRFPVRAKGSSMQMTGTPSANA